MVATTDDDDGFQTHTTKQQRKNNNRNKNNRNNNNNNNNNKSQYKQKKKGGGGGGFGSKSWSKPASINQNTTTTTTIESEKKNETHNVNLANNNVDINNNNNNNVVEESVVEEWLEEFVSNEINEACLKGDDPTNTVIASTAAVSMLLSTMNMITSDDNSEEKKEQQQQQQGEEETPITNNNKDDNQYDVEEPSFDFQSRCKMSMSELMKEFGEQDLNWQKQEVTITQEEEKEEPKEEQEQTTTTQNNHGENRLTIKGKAPIDVLIISFGYIHGVPTEITKNGWSYGNPLTPLDCRAILPPVPKYMAWRDGYSNPVQRAVLFTPITTTDNDDDDDAGNKEETTTKDKIGRDVANEFADNIFHAVRQAIDQGGYGYVAPLRICVYIGSENGTHRSVVLTEHTAKQLRNLLRKNQNNVISQPVSVGTMHRNLTRDTMDKKEKKKRKDDDDFDD